MLVRRRFDPAHPVAERLEKRHRCVEQLGRMNLDAKVRLVPFEHVAQPSQDVDFRTVDIDLDDINAIPLIVGNAPPDVHEWNAVVGHAVGVGRVATDEMHLGDAPILVQREIRLDLISPRRRLERVDRTFRTGERGHEQRPRPLGRATSMQTLPGPACSTSHCCRSCS